MGFETHLHTHYGYNTVTSVATLSICLPLCPHGNHGVSRVVTLPIVTLPQWLLNCCYGYNTITMVTTSLAGL